MPKHTFRCPKHYLKLDHLGPVNMFMNVDSDSTLIYTNECNLILHCSRPAELSSLWSRIYHQALVFFYYQAAGML